MRDSLPKKLSRYLKTRELQVFIAVADSHSIAEAARVLHLSQPAVSKSIQELESTLGAPLFDRDNRGMHLTPYGEALLKRARGIFGEICAAGEEIQQLLDAGTGSVRVGVTPGVAAGFMPAVVTAFANDNPSALVSIVEGPYYNLVGQLENRAVDMVLARVDRDEVHEGLIYETLFDDPLCVVASADHALAATPVIRPEMLRDEKCILPLEDSAPYRQIARAFAAAGVELPRSRVYTLSVPLVEMLVREGGFIMIGMPRTIFERWHSPRLKVLTLSSPPQSVSVVLISVADRVQVPVIKRFLEIVRSCSQSVHS